MVSSFSRFLDHIQRRTTVGKTLLDKWSARRRDLYLTTHNTHNRQIFMPRVGFEPTISAGERPKTYALCINLVNWKVCVWSCKLFICNRKEKEIQKDLCLCILLYPMSSALLSNVREFRYSHKFSIYLTFKGATCVYVPRSKHSPFRISPFHRAF